MTGAASDDPAGPTTFRGPVRPEWIDANGHMNLAWYVWAFDQGTDALFAAAGLDAAHVAGARTGIFAAEVHTLHRRELAPGDMLEVRSRLLAVDAKRAHVAHAMRGGDGATRALQELLLLHVDLRTRRVAPWPPGLRDGLARVLAAHATLPRPDWVGRRVAMPAPS